jgi:hypothetical protein
MAQAERVLSAICASFTDAKVQLSGPPLRAAHTASVRANAEADTDSCSATGS